jgi:hypothetical protein
MLPAKTTNNRNIHGIVIGILADHDGMSDRWNIHDNPLPHGIWPREAWCGAEGPASSLPECRDGRAKRGLVDEGRGERRSSLPTGRDRRAKRAVSNRGRREGRLTTTA